MKVSWALQDSWILPLVDVPTSPQISSERSTGCFKINHNHLFRPKLQLPLIWWKHLLPHKGLIRDPRDCMKRCRDCSGLRGQRRGSTWLPWIQTFTTSRLSRPHKITHPQFYIGIQYINNKKWISWLVSSCSHDAEKQKPTKKAQWR